MLLYCIRHGESAFNAEGRIQGQLDVPLSPLGRRQGEAAADALAGLPIEAIFSSPLCRALETARFVAERVGQGVVTDPRLMEINVGVFQGKLRTEVNTHYPAEIERWVSGDPDFAIPEGESRRQLGARGLAVFSEILHSGLKQAVVVTHGGLLGAALKALLEIPAERHPFVFQNCAINRLEYSDGHGVRLLSLNEADHLRDFGPAGSGDL